MESFDLFGSLEDILAAPKPVGLQIGMAVGAGRWSYVGGHPGNWMPPHRGILLAPDDPRAWRGTVLGDNPTTEQIRAHLAWLETEQTRHPAGLRHPVLWEFNPERAMWESSAAVIPYEEDVRKWEAARALALKGAAK